MLSLCVFNFPNIRTVAPWSFVLALVVTFVVTGASATYSKANAQTEHDWHTGKRLDQFNQTAISASWADTPLRDVVSSFSTSQKVGVFLDRRIDPSSPVNISANNVSPERFLWEIAESKRLGVCRVADFYFFGAAETAATLPTIWEQMETESGRQRRSFNVRWERKKPLTTPPVVVVKRLLEQLATEHQFEIENPEAIPHDVWAKFDLPPTTLGGRVGVILVGFGKWFERSQDGTSIKIIDYPIITTASLKAETLTDPQAMALKMKADFPNLKMTGSSKRLTASGPPLEVARLRRQLVKSQAVETVAPESNRFNLNTQAPRGSILATVAQQLGKKLNFSAEIQPLLQEQIKLQIKDATLNQLLQETLKGTELRYEMTESELVISAK